jgi:predicted nucleic acid-binding protein
VPVFADTNVGVYAFAKDDAKIAIAEGILKKQPTISVQVLSEFLSVCRVNLGLLTASRRARHRVHRRLQRRIPNAVVVEKAMQIGVEAQISYWDALIVAAALLSGCDTLYTEDLQHGMVFEGQLTVVNPSLPTEQHPLMT